MNSDYLTQEDLLNHLEHIGLDVPERTLRFWVTKGVLEAPLKKPYKHADGRKKYFPTRVVSEISEIIKLQQEGWKLTQIKLRLRSPAKVNQTEQPNTEQMAKLLLEDYLNNGEFRDKLKTLDASDPSTPPWRKMRNFLVARLTHFVGRKQAVRAVTSFMVGLSGREVKKLLRRGAGKTADTVEHTATQPSPEPATLRQALKQLTPPDWSGAEKEPLLSLRLRDCLARLTHSLDSPKPDPEIIGAAWNELSLLRAQIADSVAFLAKNS